MTITYVQRSIQSLIHHVTHDGNLHRWKTLESVLNRKQQSKLKNKKELNLVEI